VDAQFWHARWRNNEIGFHMPEPHPALSRYAPSMATNGARVLVPLCGKSPDLGWLHHHGAHVVGYELSPIAVDAVFQEQPLPAPQQRQAGNLTHYHATRIDLYCGDFFDAEPTQAGPVDWIYDRAALIALPAEMRPTYVDQLRRLAPAAPILLITLAYHPQAINGPPFAVHEAEVRALFSDAQVELLATRTVLDERPRWREAGLRALLEQVYRISPQP